MSLIPAISSYLKVPYQLAVGQVIGSSPISSTKKETTPNGVVFLFG
jgi:hypothetical protein